MSQTLDCASDAPTDVYDLSHSRPPEGNGQRSETPANHQSEDDIADGETAAWASESHALLPRRPGSEVGLVMDGRAKKDCSSTTAPCGRHRDTIGPM